MNDDKTHIVKFDVLLVKSGGDKVKMMQVVMALTGWGLKQSKDLIDQPPGMVLQGVPHSKAMEAVQQLQAVGAEALAQKVVK